MTQVYRNIHFTKRDYEATNVVACAVLDASQYGHEAGANIPAGYALADPTIIDGLTPLWIEAGVRFYGYM